MNGAEGSGEIPEGSRKGGDAWTFYAVEARLIEAFEYLARLPDRERGWQRTGTMSLWRQASSTLGMSALDRVGYLLADRDQSPRKPGLTTVQVGRMDEALRWTEWVGEAERRVLGFAVGQRAGGAMRISWSRVMADMGLAHGKDGLRMRYSRAITRICVRLNRPDFRTHGVSSPFNCEG